MLTRAKYLAWPAVLALALVFGAGCPTLGVAPPNHLVAFLVSPKSLDFGTSEISLSLNVAKNFTVQNLSSFSISNGGTRWLSVSPTTASSTGPSDPVKVTVTINRDRLAAGLNEGNVVLSAPGVVDMLVPVTAVENLVANFSVDNREPAVNETIQFTDLTMVADGMGPVVSWLWSFGDGGQSTAQHPTHAYAQPGIYDVTLTAQTATLSDTRVRRGFVIVSALQGPTAEFVASNLRPPAGTPVQFTDLSDPGDGVITSWEWDFGDGQGSTLQNPSHAYSFVGRFDVSLTVTTEVGSSTETKVRYIRVQPVGPIAQFVANNRFPRVNTPVQFTDLSSPGTSPITSWLWNFGDGATSTLQNPAHIYTAVASYTVYLTVTTDVGSDSEVKPLYIQVQP